MTSLFSWFKNPTSPNDIADDWDELDRPEKKAGCPSYGLDPVLPIDKTHYREQSRTFHPDKNISCAKDAEPKFKKLSKLWNDRQKVLEKKRGGRRSMREKNRGRKTKHIKKSRKTHKKYTVRKGRRYN
jgi:hypothetical protein